MPYLLIFRLARLSLGKHLSTSDIWQPKVLCWSCCTPRVGNHSWNTVKSAQRVLRAWRTLKKRKKWWNYQKNIAVPSIHEELHHRLARWKELHILPRGHMVASFVLASQGGPLADCHPGTFLRYQTGAFGWPVGTPNLLQRVSDGRLGHRGY